jgi:hypothetical protein
MATTVRFQPERVAHYEKAGWEAYYDRRWLKCFWLLVQLNREEFAMPVFTAAAASLDIVRASIAFAPQDNDPALVRRYLVRFYAKARRSLRLQATAETLAALEIDYWVVHRQLAIRRQQDHADEDIEPMIQALTRLHAALFQATPEATRRSAELRALAAKTVDRITGNYADNVAADWRAVETYLQQAYTVIADG